MLREYLLRQTFPGTVQWLVVADCQNPKPYEKIWLDFVMRTGHADHFVHGQMHQRPYRAEDLGPKSLSQNLLHGLHYAEGEIIFICEDDDWYGPEHIKECIDHLAADKIKSVGTIWQKYYHLPSLSHRTFKNVGSALCSTAFHRDLIPKMMESAQWCGDNNRKGLDRRFWDSLDPEEKDIFEPEHNQVIGMKGLPGRFGIGVGHQPRGFEDDSNADILRAWVGNEDAEVYLKLRRQHNGSEKS